MTDGLHCVFRRSESEDGTWDRTGKFVEKVQGKLDAGLQVVREEGAGKELGRGLGRSNRQNLMSWGLLQKIDGGERGAACGGHASVSMPGRTVHPVIAIVLAQNSAIVAEHAHAGLPHPQAGGGAFAGAGVAEEEVAAAILVGQAERVEFDAFTERQAVHEDQFVDGILERKERVLGRKTWAVQDHVSAGK